jgi:hypothetical protein
VCQKINPFCEAHGFAEHKHHVSFTAQSCCDGDESPRQQPRRRAASTQPLRAAPCRESGIAIRFETGVIMRDDMYKVIVERPRKASRASDDGRIWLRNQEVGGKFGIRQAHTHRKWLNENLAPLKRWLHKQVHRPWSKVYSELSQGIDRRNTVQAHIYAHIDHFVEQHARIVEGIVYVQHWRDSWIPVRQSNQVELFVHPLTGILLPNRGYAQARLEQRQAWKKSNDARHCEYYALLAAKQEEQARELINREEKYRPIRKKLATT